MGKQHIIELNGKRYDALTGTVMLDKPTPHPATKVSASKKATVVVRPAVSRKRMDGFSFPTHKTEKSKTLMRQAVHKPVIAKIGTSIASVNTPTQKIQAAKQISAHKLAHATQIPKSTLIQRFGQSTATQNTPIATLPSKANMVANAQNTATVAKIQTNPLLEGLAKATSHQQAKLKSQSGQARLARRLRISPRLLSGASLGLAGLLIGGFFAYQNVPNLNMRVATARSGVSGSRNA